MVDLHRGVQSYLIAKSSIEQVGYELAPDTFPAPALSSRGPDRHPGRFVRGDQKNLQWAKKFKRGTKNFLGLDDGLAKRLLSRRRRT
jgi:hypothetical protein